jgi:hypothetical protein
MVYWAVWDNERSKVLEYAEHCHFFFFTIFVFVFLWFPSGHDEIQHLFL